MEKSHEVTRDGCSHFYASKLIRVMKLTFAIMFVAIMELFATGVYSQNEKVTLSLEDKTVAEVLNSIETLTDYTFFYNSGLIDVSRVVSVNVKETSVSEVLKEVFVGTDVEFKVKGNHIILTNQLTSNAATNMQQQLIKISGKVSDDNGEVIPGASVIIKGTSIGTITNMDGAFTLTEVPVNATLVFSFIGMKTKEINVGGRIVINVGMQPDVIGLDEVIAIGYGTMKKSDLTGAVGAIKGDEIAVRKTTQLSTALQGSIPGLMVTRSNNAPGSTSNIYIRGITTIGDSNPLVIVDGVPGSIDQVNPNDVENISVLKDAASASIYGSRAAAGVILVTTKRAKESELKFTYTGEYGMEIPTQQPKYVGVQRYLEMSNELRYNDNQAGGFYQTYSADQVRNWINYNETDPDNYPITDWQDMILKEFASRQTHSLFLSGGSKKVKTKASFSYDNVDGLYADRYFRRYMLRVNNDIMVNKMLEASLDFNAKLSKHHQPYFNPLSTMRIMPAIYAAVWDDGRIAEGKSGGNPYGLMKLGGDSDKWYSQVGGKASLDFKPVKGMKISAVAAPVFYYNKFKRFKKEASYYDADNPELWGGYLDDGGNKYAETSLAESRNDGYKITSQLLANYNRKINAHSINIMAGYENYYEMNESMGASRGNYILTAYPYLNAGPESVLGNNGDANEYAYRSYFGRIMYSYNNKYMFQANIRHDGSSRFASEYRWGTFPSASVGWVLSEENFLKDRFGWLSFLKLRGSWGQLGNERIGNYPYLTTMIFNNSLIYENDEVNSFLTAAQREYAVENISWETTESTDVGIDLNLFDNRLQLTADYYWKSTKDMLLNMDIPNYMGYSDPDVNAGKMETTGYDIQVGWNNRVGDWRYGISVNFSDFVSKMGYLNNTEFISGSRIKREGSEFNEWYGYISEGLFLTQDDVDNSPKINEQVTVGDVKYKDISGPDGVPDGIISAEYDRVLLGGSLPRFQYGGNINVAYKNIDFSLAFSGVGKRNVRLDRAMIEPLRSNYGNIPLNLDGNYWSVFNTDEQNARAKYPRLTRENVESNMAMSDFWLFDGRYFRVKNISLGYTIPKNITEKVNISGIRVYASASDVFCLSNYPDGWDPEMGVSEYPITTSLIFGLSVNF